MPEMYMQFIYSAGAILFLLIIRWIILQILFRRVTDTRLRYNWTRFSAHGVAILSLIVLGQIWIEHFSTLVTYLGLVSAGVAIALGDLLKNLAGWLFIIWRRPFTLGDRIEMGQHAGDVIDIRLFQFTILEVGNWVKADQSTGRIIHIPNGKIFSEHLSNYFRGFAFIWSELPITITFESNWRKAKSLLQKVVDENTEHLTDVAQERIREASQRFMIYYTKLTPIVYTSVLDNGVCLTLRYLTEPRRRRLSDEKIWEAVLTVFAAEDDIDFAYPTTRFFDNRNEGKAEA
ncbi:MAG: mechanosensitive ion channel [Leptospiraceae bacterium]|nr:mechanosensitive ion channel [Leptospiraceae bacterium]